MTRTGIFAAAAALLAGCVSIEAHHHDVDETMSPPPGSNLMLRGPITISDDLEVIISDVVIPAGATVPRHFHPGEEFVYVIEGAAVHVEAGKPDTLISAGEAFVIGVVGRPATASGLWRTGLVGRGMPGWVS